MMVMHLSGDFVGCFINGASEFHMAKNSSMRTKMRTRECVCVDACVCDVAVPHSRRRSSNWHLMPSSSTP